MADNSSPTHISITPAGSVSAEAVETYREANAYARNIYEQFFKLATMSFIFNAALLTAMSFVLGNNLSGEFEGIRPIGVVALSILGVVYNGGALCSYNKAMKAWRLVNEAILQFEIRITDGISTQECFPPYRNEKQPNVTVERLTNIFFWLWIVVWASGGIYLAKLTATIATD